jgi:PleD family two-component response regulator
MMCVEKMPTMITIKSIVLADDDSDDSLIFKDALKEVGPSINLTVVKNGRALMQLLRNYAPDMIFLDLDMPYQNGLECLVEMNTIPALQQTPKIVFSSTSRAANIDTAYEMGAHLFFTKLSTYAEQRAALKAILKLHWQDPEGVREQYCVNGRYTAFM